MSYSLWPHEPQHARPLYLSPTPGLYPNPCPLSRWCHPTISSSVVPFSSCPQSFPASGSFQMSQLFASGGQSIGVSASMNTQDWSPLGWTGWISLQPKGLSRVLFIIGDWNAKVGSQETPGVTGTFGLGVQNEAGQRLIEFWQENTLVIEKTLFQQYMRRLYTWTSPDGQPQNQIDYILCSQRWRSSIQSAKTRPGADCGSDHELLIANSDWNWRKWRKPIDHSGMTWIKYFMTIQWKWEIDLRD